MRTPVLPTMQCIHPVGTGHVSAAEHMLNAFHYVKLVGGISASAGTDQAKYMKGPKNYCGKHRMGHSLKVVILLWACISSSRREEKWTLAQCFIM